jgi:hypothetical protein
VLLELLLKLKLLENELLELKLELLEPLELLLGLEELLELDAFDMLVPEEPPVSHGLYCGWQ